MRETINITRGTDVVLNDRLLFRGRTFDPSLCVNVEAHLVSRAGVRTALCVEVVDDYLVITIPWITGRLPGLYGLEVRGMTNGLRWATYADSLIRYTTSTQAGDSPEVTVSSDAYDISQQVSYRYGESPISEVRVAVDGSVGEPSVEASYVSRVLSLLFKGVKGNGIASLQTIQESQLDGEPSTYRVTDEHGNHMDITVRNGHRGTGIERIDTEESQQDGGENLVKIKTTADEDGEYSATLRVKNGKNGNGIASITETPSDEDGGTNVVTIHHTDPNVPDTVLYIKNGRQGIPGEGAIWNGNAEVLTELEQTTGQATNKTMSQKAVTDIINGIKDNLAEMIAEESLRWQKQSTLPTKGFVNGQGLWYVADNYTHAHFSAEGVRCVKITGNASKNTHLAFLRTYTEPVSGEPLDLCVDLLVISNGETKTYDVPSGCTYIAVSMQTGSTTTAPQSVYVGRHVAKPADTLTAKEGALRQRYAGCSLCLIGDSISSYQGDVPEGATYQYPAKGVTSLDMMYYKRLVDNLGFKSYLNLSYGGSGAVRYDQSATHPSLFERVAFVQQADVIIIELYVNDYGHQVPIGTADYDTAIGEMDESTFYDAYIKGLKELMRKFPKAQIILMLTEERILIDSSQRPITAESYQDAVRNIAAHYGLMVIDASQAYSTYGYSDVHPRITEMELLYESCIDNLLQRQNEGERKKGKNVCEYLTPINFSLYPPTSMLVNTNTGLWVTSIGNKAIVIAINAGDKYRIQAKETNPSSAYILSEDNRSNNVPVAFATGFQAKKAIVVPAGESVDFISPADGRYLFLTMLVSGMDRSPKSISKVNEINVQAVKAVADDYFNAGGGSFHIGGADKNNGTLDNSNVRLARTDLIACAGMLNISIDVPNDMSIDGAYLLRYSDGVFVDAIALDSTALSHSVKVSGFTHAILRLYNTEGYTIDQWSAITYSFTTGMKHLIGYNSASGVESESIKDQRIDYVRSIQTKTKVLEIEDQEMIPTTGMCFTAHDGHLYFSVDGVKYEINKTQVQ